MTVRPADGPSLDLPTAIPYVEFLGVRLVEMADGRALARFEARPEHTNSWGSTHGGVVMSVLDFIMAMAGRSAYEARARAEAGADRVAVAPPAGNGGNVTIEMKTSFLRPASGHLTFRGVCLQSGKSVSFCEGEAVDEAGRLVARASGTFKFLPAGDPRGSPRRD